MCLLLPCAIGFFARLIAETLSTRRVIASPSLLLSSFNRFISHMAWQAHNDAAIYSASQDESATTSSFFEHQEIGVLPSIKMYPAIDFLSSLSPHQLESVKPSKSHFRPVSNAGKRIPQPRVPLMYPRILLTAAI